VTEKEEAGKEGDGKGSGAIAFPEGGKVEGEQQEPIEEETRTEVDEEVDEVVTKDLETSKVIVQGKGKVGKDAQRLFAVGLDELVEPMEGEALQLDARVFDDVGFIVEKERDPEGIGIGQKGQNSHEANGHHMPDGEPALFAQPGRWFRAPEERAPVPPLFSSGQRSIPPLLES
jgi:hypothetical protein